METLYLYRFIAILCICIPFLRYCVKFAFAKLKENADKIDRETKSSAFVCLVMVGGGIPMMFISTIIRVDNIYFGPKFTFSIVVLVVTIILAIADVILKKHYVKYVSAIVGLLSAIVPTIYFVWAMFIDKVPSPIE